MAKLRKPDSSSLFFLNALLCFAAGSSTLAYSSLHARLVCGDCARGPVARALPRTYLILLPMHMRAVFDLLLC